MDTLSLPFSKIFNSQGPSEHNYVPTKFEVRSFSLPIPEAEIIATEVLGMRTPNLGEEEAVGSRRW